MIIIAGFIRTTEARCPSLASPVQLAESGWVLGPHNSVYSNGARIKKKPRSQELKGDKHAQ